MQMFEYIKLFLKVNYDGVLFVTGISFCVGLAIGISSFSWNREKKKKGFRTGEFKGAGKILDKKIEKDIERIEREKRLENESKSRLEDGMEYHANKKFR